jgi:hypothetical protein
MGYLHNPTDICEHCVVRHFQMSYDKKWIDPICENWVVRHNLSDCVNRPLTRQLSYYFVRRFFTVGAAEIRYRAAEINMTKQTKRYLLLITAASVGHLEALKWIERFRLVSRLFFT